MSYGMIANAEGLFPGFRFVIWPLAGQDWIDAMNAHEAAHPEGFGPCLVLDGEPEMRPARRAKSQRCRSR
jgi:hypothetical protein